MSAALRAPLVAAAVVCFACALARLVHPLWGLALGAAVAVAATVLARASADAARRRLWASVALAAAASALRVFVSPTGLPAPDDGGLVALRETLGAPLRVGVPEPESGILFGIVLGERASIGRELRDAFAATGTTHLLAISGFNMTLVAGAVALALQGRARPQLVALAGVAAVVAYSVLVGPAPSVMRAALMSAVAAVGVALGRRGVALNALGAAAGAMLVADPLALEDVGFLLSVAATAGLIAWQRSLADRLSRLPGPVAEGLAATCAASAPTLPIVAAAFGRVSVVSPLANLVAVPLFAPIMAFGAATVAVGAVSPAAAWPLAMAAYASASALRRAVELFAALPLASAEVPRGLGTGMVLALLLALAAVGLRAAAGRMSGATAATRAWLARRDRPQLALSGRTAVFAVAPALVAAGAIAATSFGSSPELRVTALDVGQGDAFLLESRGRYALVDGGPDPARLLARLGERLPPWHRRLDVVALTHEHADHALGLFAVLERYDVGLAVEPAGMNDVEVSRLWWEHLRSAGVPRRALAAGARIRLGDAVLDVLAPTPDRALAVPDLVIRARAGTRSILFMGDATDDAIADLLLDPAALRASVYVPPHHGAATPYGAALVEAVRPEAALLSVGASNRYGHPTPETLAALAAIPTYRTDRHGTVEVTLDAAPLVVRTAKATVPPGGRGPLPRATAAR